MEGGPRLVTTRAGRAFAGEHSLVMIWFGLSYASWLFCLLVRLSQKNDHLVPWMNACISSSVSLPSLLVSIALKIRS